MIHKSSQKEQKKLLEVGKWASSVGKFEWFQGLFMYHTDSSSFQGRWRTSQKIAGASYRWELLDLREIRRFPFGRTIWLFCCNSSGCYGSSTQFDSFQYAKCFSIQYPVPLNHFSVSWVTTNKSCRPCRQVARLRSEPVGWRHDRLSLSARHSTLIGLDRLAYAAC